MSTLSHSQRLNKKVELLLPTFCDMSNDLVSHPQFRALYPELLVRMHWMIRASVPIMRTTLERCRQLAATDPVAAGMAPYLEQHIKEEMHHDDWLLEDLESLGVPREVVLRRIPSPSAAALVGARYYWVLHHHPIAELGAMAVTEGHPTSIEAIDVMQEVTGLPRAAFRTIEKHAHIDVHHGNELFAVIDSLPLEDSHHEILGLAAMYTTTGAAGLYREMIEEASQLSDMAAA